MTRARTDAAASWYLPWIRFAWLRSAGERWRPMTTVTASPSFSRRRRASPTVRLLIPRRFATVSCDVLTPRPVRTSAEAMSARATMIALPMEIFFPRSLVARSELKTRSTSAIQARAEVHAGTAA